MNSNNIQKKNIISDKIKAHYKSTLYIEETRSKIYKKELETVEKQSFFKKMRIKKEKVKS